MAKKLSDGTGLEYRADGVAVVHLGSMYFENSASRKIGDYIQEAIEKGARGVAIDFGSIGFAPSEFVGQIAGAYTSVKNAGIAPLYLLNVNEKQLRVLELVGIHKQEEIRIRNSIEQIVAELSSQSR